MWICTITLQYYCHLETNCCLFNKDKYRRDYSVRCGENQKAFTLFPKHVETNPNVKLGGSKAELSQPICNTVDLQKLNIFYSVVILHFSAFFATFAPLNTIAYNAKY